MAKGSRKKTVAIVGARGIGRHHANWWKLAGVRVCAISATSIGSAFETASMLKEMMGFRGEGYVEIQQMLDEQQPTFLDVCSPDPCHAQHAQLGLTSGCHVLCEKPFGYDSSKTTQEIMAETDELLKAAAGNGLALGLCSQHFITSQSCLRLYSEANPDTPVRTFEGELASPGRGRATAPDIIWSDLGPHMLAAVQAVTPKGKIIKDSIETEFVENDVAVTFRVERKDTDDLSCRIRVYKTTGEPTHVRCLAFNGYRVDLDGVRGDDGIYNARLTTPDGVHVEDDPLRQTIQRMADLDPSITGPMIRKNQKWLLAIRDAARSRD